MSNNADNFFEFSSSNWLPSSIILPLFKKTILVYSFVIMPISWVITNNVVELEKQIDFENDIKAFKEQIELERTDIADNSENFEKLEILRLMDELELKEKNAEIQNNRLLELKRKLELLENKQKQEKKRIDTDSRVPLLEIVSKNINGKRGTIIGVARDNVKVAEVTVDGK